MKKAVDLRCYLTLHGEGLTETWSINGRLDWSRSRLRWMCACVARCFRFDFSRLAVRAHCLDVLHNQRLERDRTGGLLLFFRPVCLDRQRLRTHRRFCDALLGRDPAAIQLSEVAGRPLRTRTAISMPVYTKIRAG